MYKKVKPLKRKNVKLKKQKERNHKMDKKLNCFSPMF